jgi:hypothetical protein
VKRFKHEDGSGRDEVRDGVMECKASKIQCPAFELARDGPISLLGDAIDAVLALVRVDEVAGGSKRGGLSLHQREAIGAD